MDIECLPPEEGGQLELGKSLAIGMTVGFLCGCFAVLVLFIVLKYFYPQTYAKNNRLASTGTKDKMGIASRASTSTGKGQQQQQTQRNGQGKRPKFPNQVDADQERERNVHSALSTKGSTSSRQTEVEETDGSPYVKFGTNTPYCEQNEEQPTYVNVSNFCSDYVINYGAQGCNPVNPESDGGYLHMKSPSASKWAHH